LHQKLAYALIPLGGAIVILEERMPTALGLIAGFNALDGD
jgi:predicted lipoprotein